MARLLGHRQTKGTVTDKPNLMLPRYISTLLYSGGYQKIEKSGTLQVRSIAYTQAAAMTAFGRLPQRLFMADCAHSADLP